MVAQPQGDWVDARLQEVQVDNTIASIDVGTTKVCTLVGEVNELGILRIVGVGVSTSHGMRKGVVVNANEAADTIVASVERAERISGYHVTRAYVGVAGTHVTSLNSRGVVAIPRGDQGTSDADISRALDASQAISIPEHAEIIHVVPRGYSIDGQEGVSDPRGMFGARLEVEAHIVTGSTPAIQNLVKCVNSLDIEMDQLILAPLASGEAVLTDTERAMGVALTDIGGGTTDVAIFIEGSVWHTAILPVGGNHLTNDVAICLRTPFEEAERIKKKYGHACPDQVASDEMMDIAAFGENTHQRVSRRELTEVLNARVEEIASLILKEIKRSGYDGLLPAGVVLCGGTSNLPGIRDVVGAEIGLPVRIGRPHDLQGLVDTLNNPAYATSVGLLMWDRNHRPVVRHHSAKPPLTGRMAKWFRNLLPG